MRDFIKKHRYTLIICITSAIIIAVIFMLFGVDSGANARVVEYIGGYGWEVEQTPCEISHLTIPREFDIVYSTYNSLNKTAGFDLEPYKGARVTRYTYKVLNHELSATGLIRANVLVYKNEVIAADISSLSAGGFMTPINDTNGQIK